MPAPGVRQTMPISATSAASSTGTPTGRYGTEPPRPRPRPDRPPTAGPSASGAPASPGTRPARRRARGRAGPAGAPAPTAPRAVAGFQHRNTAMPVAQKPSRARGRPGRPPPPLVDHQVGRGRPAHPRTPSRLAGADRRTRCGPSIAAAGGERGPPTRARRPTRTATAGEHQQRQRAGLRDRQAGRDGDRPERDPVRPGGQPTPDRGPQDRPRPRANRWWGRRESCRALPARVESRSTQWPSVVGCERALPPNLWTVAGILRAGGGVTNSITRFYKCVIEQEGARTRCSDA
jgi:hypothetical protein